LGQVLGDAFPLTAIGGIGATGGHRFQLDKQGLAGEGKGVIADDGPELVQEPDAVALAGPEQRPHLGAAEPI
jgi:hypothetical protein